MHFKYNDIPGGGVMYSSSTTAVTMVNVCKNSLQTFLSFFSFLLFFINSWIFSAEENKKDVKELKSDMLNIHPPIFQTAFPKIHVNTSRTCKQAFSPSRDSNHSLACSETAESPTETSHCLAQCMIYDVKNILCHTALLCYWCPEIKSWRENLSLSHYASCQFWSVLS